MSAPSQGHHPGTRFASHSARRSRRSRNPHVPRFEFLEQRLALSTYYVAPTGSDDNTGSEGSPFATLQHAMMSLEPGDTLDVESGSYAGFIVGWDSTAASTGDPYGTIDGTASAPITIQAAPGTAPGSVVIDSQDNKTQAGIDLEPGDNYINISGITINGSSGGLAEYPNHGEGIKVAGSIDVTVENCTVTNIDYGFGIIVDNVSNVALENNNISGTGSSGNADYGHGIYLSGSSSDLTVTGNVIDNNSYIGIHVNGDGGVVTNALIEGNYIYNNGQNGINADGIENSVIENNLIYNYQDFGICLYQIDASAGSSNNVIVNNTIDAGTSSDAGAALRILDGSTGNTILNNILLGGGGVTLRISSDSMSGLVSNYNVVGSLFQSEDTGSTESLGQWQSQTGQDENSLIATPQQLFVDPSNNDYQELPTSPSVDAGTAQDAPDVDIEGNPRPAGNGYDIGCYEYQPPPTVSQVTPSVGPVAGGTEVTITGTDLAFASAVDFGNDTVTSFLSDTNGQIVMDSPAAAAGPVDVTVVTAGGTSATSPADQFTYDDGPTLTAIKPVAPNTRNTPVATIEVTFSVPVNTATFSADAVSLTDNGDASPSPVFRFP